MLSTNLVWIAGLRTGVILAPSAEPKVRIPVCLRVEKSDSCVAVQVKSSPDNAEVTADVAGARPDPDDPLLDRLD